MTRDEVRGKGGTGSGGKRTAGEEDGKREQEETESEFSLMKRDFRSIQQRRARNTLRITDMCSCWYVIGREKTEVDERSLDFRYICVYVYIE